MIIEIDGIAVEVIRKKIKNINLRIYPPLGQVKVSVPHRYNLELLKQHLQTKIAWIKEQQNRIQKNNFYQTEEQCVQTGSIIPFKGEQYTLFLIEHYGPNHINLLDKTLYFYMKPNTTMELRQKYLEQWYRRELELVLPNLIRHWEKIISVKVLQWGIKQMKTRWGSCNTRAQRIWLNLNLIKKPLICLEYVLVHELIHLLEPSHNARFYTLMSQFMPLWREYQHLLEGTKDRKNYPQELSEKVYV